MADIGDAIQLFLNAVPDDWEFPCGGATSIPIPEEVCLSDSILKLNSESAGDVRQTWGNIGVKNSYELAIFAVRMAVLAVRTQEPERLRSGVFGLLLADKIDWRDRICAAAILQHCAARLHLDLEPMVDSFGSVGIEQKKRIVGGRLESGATHEHALDSYGFVSRGQGKEFCIEHKTRVWTRAELLAKFGKNPS